MIIMGDSLWEWKRYEFQEKVNFNNHWEGAILAQVVEKVWGGGTGLPAASHKYPQLRGRIGLYYDPFRFHSVIMSRPRSITFPRCVQM